MIPTDQQLENNVDQDKGDNPL